MEFPGAERQVLRLADTELASIDTGLTEATRIAPLTRTYVARKGPGNPKIDDDELDFSTWADARMHIISRKRR